MKNPELSFGIEHLVEDFISSVEELGPLAFVSEESGCGAKVTTDQAVKNITTCHLVLPADKRID